MLIPANLPKCLKPDMNRDRHSKRRFGICTVFPRYWTWVLQLAKYSLLVQHNTAAFCSARTLNRVRQPVPTANRWNQFMVKKPLLQHNIPHLTGHIKKYLSKSSVTVGSILVGSILSVGSLLLGNNICCSS